jgi:dTMP kinase
MTSEAELLLMNASRAQLVREIIRPALAAGEIIVCDRFYDSTTAYQGFGRQLDLEKVKSVIEFAVGEIKPNLTLFVHVPPEVSAERLRSRQSTLPFVRDRIEEADRKFFERVAHGYGVIAASEPQRVKFINGAQAVDAVCKTIWEIVQSRLPKVGRW